MHELGVAFHIADSVVKIAEENQAEKIHKVTLELGEVSTVIPEYLIDVWNWHCKRVPILNDCVMEIETIKAITFCDSCKKTYETVPQGKICPHCGSEETWLQTGNEVNIKDIVIE